MKQIACIQHLAEEGPGALADWAVQCGVGIEVFRADLGQLPSHAGYAAYVLLGGPFDAVGATCPPWLEQEKVWLDGVLRQAKPVLGICLGGQLLADRLGARVAPIDRPEGGWCEVELIGEGAPRLEVLQWHERGFALPAGARHLARGADWANQGYAVGEALLGLQFHPEWTPPIVAALNRRFGAESPLPQPAAADEARYARMHAWFFDLLERWAQSWPEYGRCPHGGAAMLYRPATQALPAAGLGGEDMTVFLNGAFVAAEDAKISVFDRGFIFGDGLYELIPVYAGKPFRLEQHLQRLEHGLGEIRIDNPYPRAEWQRLIGQLLAHHQGQQLSLYVQVTRGVAPRDHVFPVPAPTPTVLMTVSPLPQPSQAAYEQGIRAVTQADYRWGRCDIKAVSLLANVLLRQHAADVGAGETILIRDGMLTEGSTSTVFIVKDGVIAVPPLSHLMLPGITYDVLLELAQRHGAPVAVRPIGEAELHAADEVWIASSSKEVLAVVELDGKPVGDGRVGPLQRKMFAWYQAFKHELMAS